MAFLLSWGATGPTRLADRSMLSERQCLEFAKTAVKVAAKPWEMHRASNYLMEFIGNNQTGFGKEWSAPHLPFVTGKRFCIDTTEITALGIRDGLSNDSWNCCLNTFCDSLFVSKF